MQLSIALTRQNLDQLDSKLITLSSPGLTQYGQWLNKDDLETQFPLVDDTAVVSWLQSAGISSISRDGSLLIFTGSVGTINKLLDTEFAYYKKGSSVKLRTADYSIPDELFDYIELISPTTCFGQTHGSTSTSVLSQPRRRLHRRSAPTYSTAACEESIAPVCLKDMYNVGSYTTSTSAGSRIGFASFLNQFAQYSDLAKYEALNNIPAQSFAVELANGGVNNQSAATSDTGEANQDVQMIVAVSNPLPIFEYIAAGTPPFLPDADEYEYLLTKDGTEIPQVLSIPYGDYEQTVPEMYAKRVCNAIGLNTLRGITILHSSGNTGVGSACQASDLVTPQFHPIFPATCPSVTSVGGTSDVILESAWNASSGGLLNYFSRAWFLNTAVQTYLDHHISPKTKQYCTNVTGRGFPDVFARSLYHIFIYSVGYKALNDIVTGGSFGCSGVSPQTGEAINGSLVIPYAHWNANYGWDPVTGLDTPDFQKWKAMVMALWIENHGIAKPK